MRHLFKLTGRLRSIFSVLVFASFAFTIQAQQTISGKVLDNLSQEPLYGATIMVVGTSNGVISDQDGNFRLFPKTPFPLTIQISYLGYEKKKLTLDAPKNDLVISLDFGKSLNEVVITSQLREQELQDVPIAVSVIGAQRVADKPTINNVGDIITDVPGLSGGDFPGGAVYSVRGISSNTFNNSIESSVGIFTDGFFTGRLTAANNEFFDIKRIEVLKGPQGTLFGRNTSAGAISIVTNSAKDYKDLTVSGVVGNEGQLQSDYVLNLPVTETFRFRIAGRFQQRDGIVKATDPVTGTTQELGKIDLFANRLGLVWEPSEKFKADLKVSYTDSDRGGSPFVTIAGNNPIFQQLQIPVTTDRFARETFMNGPVFDKTKNFTGILNLTTKFSDKLHLESITAYNDNRLDFQVDSDQTALVFTLFESVDKFNTFNQEFRLKGTSEKIDWLVAANGFYQQGDQENNLISSNFSDVNFFVPGLPQALQDAIFNSGLDLTSTDPYREESLHKSKILSASIFSDATWHVNDRLDVTLGLRISHDAKEIQYLAELAPGTVQQVTGLNIQSFGEQLGAANIKRKENWTAFQPRINISYKLTENTMVYGGYSRGYKPGGFGYYLLAPVEPEKNNAYEIGLKSTFPDGYGFLNLSAFLYDYRGLQIEQLRDFVTVVENASDVRSAGIEAELGVNVTEEFTFGGNLSLVDAKFENFISPVDGNLSGGRPPFTPDATIQIYTGYEKGFTTLGTVYAQVDYTYQSRMFFNQNNDPAFATPGYGLLNAGAGIRGVFEGRADIGFFANNITNQKYITTARPGLPGFPYVSRGLPFIAGVSLKLNNILEW